MTKRVLLVDPIPQQAARLLVEDPDFEVAVYRPDRDGADIGKVARGYDALIVGETPLDAKTITDASQGGSLKIIAKVGRSAANIDLQAAVAGKVAVMNTPGYEANAVAEYTIGLIFSLSRSIVQGAGLVKEGKWHRRHRLAGGELSGKTLGVLGLGDEGKLVAQKGSSLGMPVLAHDLYLPFRDRKGAAEAVGAEYASLDDLLRGSDYVAVLLPEEKKTEKLLGKRELSLMKGGAYLINMTPGVIEDAILYEALGRRVIAGAAVDVGESGGISKRSKLLTLDNFIATPQLSALSKEAWEKQGMQAAELVRDALKRGAYKNVVTPRY